MGLANCVHKVRVGYENLNGRQQLGVGEVHLIVFFNDVLLGSVDGFESWLCFWIVSRFNDGIK